MTVDHKVQQAISTIKAGDRQSGQRLLAEAIKENPKNETAWLWMASLLSGDRRRLCLEKVLAINPNNTLAQAQLDKLAAATASTAENTVRVTPVVQPAPAPSTLATGDSNVPAPPREPHDDQFWFMPGKNLSTIIWLSANTLLAFDVLPHLAPKLVNEIKGGITQKQLHVEKSKYHLQSVCYLPLARVKTISLFGELMKVLAVDHSGRETQFHITCNKANTDSVMDALQMQLGPQFTKITRPISRSQVFISGFVLLLITLCGTGFFYWFVQGLAREEQISGSARARGIANLLLLIGPNGFLCIGGVLLLVIIVALLSSLSKPPEETALVARAGQ